MKWILIIVPAALLSAQPAITNLQPRGAQSGRPFTLTVSGKNLTEGAKIWSTMPATFTPLAAVKMDAAFLVEPTGNIPVGVYPIRVETPEGISNIQLFSVGSFPEYLEDESRPGALPNSNDTIETAQPLPAGNLVLNGSLHGPERDVFRISAKRGEKRVFEVEARRCGSAIDPVIEIEDASGKVIARSEDTPLLGLDARIATSFPRDGFYYVAVHDARYSTQSANFYRLKSGQYDYATEVFPLGGRRGQVTKVSLGARSIDADLSKVEPNSKLTFLNLPDSGALPVAFAIGDDPEVLEPVASPVEIPITINGRLSKPSEVDRYQLRVTPGEPLLFHVEAAELGTSKLMAVITVFDDKGKKLAASGDEPLAEDVYNVNQSRTAGDPILRLQAPAGASTLTVTVEDLALRGGPNYAYRLNVKRMAQDFHLILNAAYVNIPAGGSITVPVTVQRQGYDGPIQLSVSNPPKGLRVEGGYVVPGAPVKETPQNRNSRGVLILTAEPGASFSSMLTVSGVAKLPDRTTLLRTAEGPGMTVAVTGATQQGSVDRQRPITAPWLNLELAAALTKSRPATLEVSLVELKRMPEGDQIKFRWKWHSQDSSLMLPKKVTSELVGSGDTRMIDVQPDADDPSTGTFLITTTKLTIPSKYDLYISGKLKFEGQEEEIVSRPISVLLEEVKAANVSENTTGR